MTEAESLLRTARNIQELVNSGARNSTREIHLSLQLDRVIEAAQIAGLSREEIRAVSNLHRTVTGPHNRNDIYCRDIAAKCAPYLNLNTQAPTRPAPADDQAQRLRGMMSLQPVGGK